MEIVKIEQRAGCRAPSDRIWTLLSDLSAWDRWNPYETEASGTIAFGSPITLMERLPGLPEQQVQAVVRDWQPLTQLVWTQKRGWLFNTVRYFEIEELETESCIIATGTIFSGLRAELFHDKHKKAIKAAYGEIIEGLRLAAEAD